MKCLRETESTDTWYLREKLKKERAPEALLEEDIMVENGLQTNYTFRSFATVDKLTTYLNNQSIPIDMIVNVEYDSKNDEWVLIYLKYTIAK